jgi:hypothetical protein
LKAEACIKTSFDDCKSPEVISDELLSSDKSLSNNVINVTGTSSEKLSSNCNIPRLTVYSGFEFIFKSKSLYP